MKNTLFLALIILAVIPASAQKAASPNCSSDCDAATALAQDYAARVDGLLRDVHASLQKISESVEAGRLTPEQAQKLKLAATRDMISRLDTLAAIYDARLDSNNKLGAGSESVAGNASAADSTAHATRGTISVEELKREAAAATITLGAVQVAR